MKLRELTLTVSKNGTLKFPSSLLAEMDLHSGDNIRVAYLTKDGTINSFKEFLLAADDTPAYGEEQQRITIPYHLLQQANIPSEADIQIICLDGILIIGIEPALNSAELAAVLDGLSVVTDIIDQIPSDSAPLHTQLMDAIDNLRREYES